jgi:hypothetical protein
MVKKKIEEDIKSDIPGDPRDEEPRNPEWVLERRAMIEKIEYIETLFECGK